MLIYRHWKKLVALTNKEAILNSTNERLGTRYSSVVLSDGIKEFKLGYVNTNLHRYLRLDIIKKHTPITYDTLQAIVKSNSLDAVLIIRGLKNYQNILEDISNEVCCDKIGVMIDGNLFLN